MHEKFAENMEKNLLSRGYKKIADGLSIGAEASIGPDPNSCSESSTESDSSLNSGPGSNMSSNSGSAFAQNDGGILYIIVVVKFNEDMAARVNARLSVPRLEDSYKNIFIINIFTLSESDDPVPLIKYINASEGFSGQKTYKVNWGVRLTERGYDFYHSKNQPDKILILRSIIDDCAVTDGTANGGAKPEEHTRAAAKRSGGAFTYAIIILCGLILALMEMNGGSGRTYNLLRFGAVFRPLVMENREYYRLFSAMFIHIGLAHYLSNALGMFIIGLRAEKYFGSLKFGLIYILSGLFGNLLCLFTVEGVLAGASGAVFGAEGALLALILKTGRPADGFTPLFILIFVTAGLCFSALFPNVANYAHAGGLVCGFALGWAMCPKD